MLGYTNREKWRSWFVVIKLKRKGYIPSNNITKTFRIISSIISLKFDVFDTMVGIFSSEDNAVALYEILKKNYRQLQCKLCVFGLCHCRSKSLFGGKASFWCCLEADQKICRILAKKYVPLQNWLQLTSRLPSIRI